MIESRVRVDSISADLIEKDCSLQFDMVHYDFSHSEVVAPVGCKTV